MSATSNSNEKLKAGAFANSVVKTGLGLAVVFGALSIVFALKGSDHWKRFFYAYVTAWSFVTSLSIGALFFVIVHHLVRARWSTVLRRVAEGMTGAFPVLFIAGLGFIVPLVLGYQDLYFWAHHDAHSDHHLHAKLGWLNPSFFAIRYGIYGALFIGISRFFASRSRAQDESGDPAISETLRIASGPAAFVYAITTVFFGFDIMMSLAPKWYSTIYSVNFFGGAMIGLFAFMIVFTSIMQRAGRVTHAITTEHYHDMGKWLFAWTFFWAYTAFSQFMLIWYANIPEETVFYRYRMFTDWQPVTIAVMVGHWALPFVLLLSRWTKRIRASLVFFAVWQLVFHWLDLYWNVMPNYTWASAVVHGKSVFTGPLAGNIGQYAVGFSPEDVTLFVAMLGVFLIGLGRSLVGNLIPVKDPTLASSMSFENY